MNTEDFEKNETKTSSSEEHVRKVFSPEIRFENGLGKLETFGVTFMERIVLPPQDDEKPDTSTLVLEAEMVSVEDELSPLVLSKDDVVEGDADALLNDDDDLLLLQPTMRVVGDEFENVEGGAGQRVLEDNDVLVLSNAMESKASVHYSARVDFPITDELIDIIASRVWVRIKEKISLV